MNNQIKDYPKNARICFLWNQLPYHAAVQYKAAMDLLKEDVLVIGSPHNLPIVGIEEALGQRILEVDISQRRSCKDLGIAVPQLLIGGGWIYPAFDKISEEVKLAGGHTIVQTDSYFQKNARQLLGFPYFRFFIKPRFDGVLVGGASGKTLMRLCGFKEKDIYEGALSGNSLVFNDGQAMKNRKKRIVFSGRYIDRKGVLETINAFNEISKDFPEWQLEMFGDGELKNAMQEVAAGNPAIKINKFAQSEEMAEILKDSRFLILASKSDKWPLVVHEAASCGCNLIVSKEFGSLVDLVRDGKNAVIVKSVSKNEVKKALQKALSWSDARMDEGRKMSLELSSKFSIYEYAKTIKRIADRYLK